jgi:Arc/MetJ-type ribon-helix-helix transcriptional regulator
MTDNTTVVQARVPSGVARQADEDAALLGLPNRSAAVREGLRLLHRRARELALARDYDDFYQGEPAPLGEVAAVGDQVAAETITERERGQ